MLFHDGHDVLLHGSASRQSLIVGTSYSRRSSGLGFLTSVGEVGDDDASLRKLGDDVQPPAHRLDVGAKVGDIHVSPSLQLGDRRLVDVENIADRLLGHRPRLSQLMKGHGCAELRLASLHVRP